MKDKPCALCASAKIHSTVFRETLALLGVTLPPAPPPAPGPGCAGCGATDGEGLTDLTPELEAEARNVGGMVARSRSRGIMPDEVERLRRDFFARYDAHCAGLYGPAWGAAQKVADACLGLWDSIVLEGAQGGD